ncbi:hypothetical protein T310_10165, partial [Rasamsonia emersonii CBS 393.64]
QGIPAANETRKTYVALITSLTIHPFFLQPDHLGPHTTVFVSISTLVASCKMQCSGDLQTVSNDFQEIRVTYANWSLRRLQARSLKLQYLHDVETGMRVVPLPSNQRARRPKSDTQSQNILFLALGFVSGSSHNG